MYYIMYLFPSLQQENPSEEDAAIVDKILSSRIVKKEVSNAIVHFALYSVSCLRVTIINIIFVDNTWSDD